MIELYLITALVFGFWGFMFYRMCEKTEAHLWIWYKLTGRLPNIPNRSAIRFDWEDKN